MIKAPESLYRDHILSIFLSSQFFFTDVDILQYLPDTKKKILIDRMRAAKSYLSVHITTSFTYHQSLI